MRITNPLTGLIAPTADPRSDPQADVQQTLDVATAIRRGQPTTVQVNTPNTIRSSDLQNDVTVQDVFAERDRREAVEVAQVNDQASLQAALLQARGNPESADPLAGLIFAEPSQAQQQQETALEEQRGFLAQARDFFGGRERDSVGRLQELRDDAGAPDLEARIADSNERVARLQGELARIRPQIETEAGQTRVGAEARLSPVERNLRAEIASEALVQSALVGNLQAVQNNIDRILELEFQDEAFEIQNLQAQIETSAAIAQTYEPAARREAEQRLQAFQLIASERANALQQKQQMKQTAIQMGLQAQQNGAPGELVARAISAGTPEQAAAMLGGYLKDPLLGLQQQKLGLEIDNLQAEQAAIQAKKDAIAAGQIILDEDQQSAAFKLIDDYEAATKDIREVSAAYTRILATAEDPSPAGDLALVFNYMKMLDPGSVVRESEFANAARTGSLEQAARNYFAKLDTGEILKFTREDFIERSQKLYEGALKDKQQIDRTFTDRSGNFNVPSEVVIRDFREPDPLENSVTAGISDDAATMLLTNLYQTSAGSTTMR